MLDRVTLITLPRFQGERVILFAPQDSDEAPSCAYNEHALAMAVGSGQWPKG